MGVQNGCPNFVSQKFKKFFLIFFLKRREGGWRIVIPMPEAINFDDGRRKKISLRLRI
jgi:hypothetical protein